MHVIASKVPRTYGARSFSSCFSISFSAFSAFLNDLTGQIFAMFILAVAASEAAIGLAILVIYFRGRGTIAVESTPGGP